MYVCVCVCVRARVCVIYPYNVRAWAKVVFILECKLILVQTKDILFVCTVLRLPQASQGHARLQLLSKILGCQGSMCARVSQADSNYTEISHPGQFRPRGNLDHGVIQTTGHVVYYCVQWSELPRVSIRAKEAHTRFLHVYSFSKLVLHAL